jgi:hypothetical protein
MTRENQVRAIDNEIGDIFPEGEGAECEDKGIFTEFMNYSAQEKRYERRGIFVDPHRGDR